MTGSGPGALPVRWILGAVVPAESPRPDRPDVATSLRTTIDELTVEFGARYSRRRIAQEATAAARDLGGSACVEALPELVTRLVRVRLGADSVAISGR